MSTRIRYYQKCVIYDDLKFLYNYRYHHSPVSINFYISADLHSISWQGLRLVQVIYSFPKLWWTPIFCGYCRLFQSLDIVPLLNLGRCSKNLGLVIGRGNLLDYMVYGRNLKVGIPYSGWFLGTKTHERDFCCVATDISSMGPYFYALDFVD